MRCKFLMMRCEVWGVSSIIVVGYNIVQAAWLCTGEVCVGQREDREDTQRATVGWWASWGQDERTETETEVTLVPTATVKDWKLSAFKLKKTVEKEKERSSSWEQEPGRDSCNHQRGKVGANYIKTLIADGCTTLHITLYTLLSSSQEYFPCSVLAPISII